MAFILFLLKYVQAGSNQQKNSSPPPFHPARAPCRAALNRKRPLLGYGRLNHQEGGSVRPMPDAPRRRAEPASVLCGEYSSTLRQVQFRTPQGMLSSARKKEGRTRDIPRIRPPFLRQCSFYSALLCSSAAAAERRRRFGFSSTALASVFTPASSGSIMMRPQYSHTMIFLRMRMSS